MCQLSLDSWHLSHLLLTHIGAKSPVCSFSLLQYICLQLSLVILSILYSSYFLRIKLVVKKNLKNELSFNDYTDCLDDADHEVYNTQLWSQNAILKFSFWNIHISLLVRFSLASALGCLSSSYLTHHSGRKQRWRHPLNIHVMQSTYSINTRAWRPIIWCTTDELSYTTTITRVYFWRRNRWLIMSEILSNFTVN